MFLINLNKIMCQNKIQFYYHLITNYLLLFHTFINQTYLLIHINQAYYYMIKIFHLYYIQVIYNH